MLKCSIGIMAYNEEKNIQNLLKSLQSQNLKSGGIEEIVVVASGCTDRTVEFVKEMQKNDKRIKLILEGQRSGKASAINLWLSKVKPDTDICIMESADTFLSGGALEKLLQHFSDKKVGVVGGRPVPSNDKNTFMGFLVHFYWGLHHEVALENPRAGELIAFRNVVEKILPDTASDETNITQVVKSKGFLVAYEPNAIVNNKGPETISDYIKQRRRHIVGYYHLKKHYPNFGSATMETSLVAKKIFNIIKPSLKNFVWLAGALAVEFAGRALAFYDWHFKKKTHGIWAISKTTKDIGV